MAMERKQGISNLELICEELLEEERAKEQKREQKRQKRKKKKAKSSQIIDPAETQSEETSVQCEVRRNSVMFAFASLLCKILRSGELLFEIYKS
jgi:hypothetical protein